MDNLGPQFFNTFRDEDMERNLPQDPVELARFRDILVNKLSNMSTQARPQQDTGVTVNPLSLSRPVAWNGAGEMLGDRAFQDEVRRVQNLINIINRRLSPDPQRPVNF